MKCLIFIFTVCSIGTFIDGQGETDTEAEQTGESFELDINEEVPSSHSHEDENNNDGEITLGSSDYELTEQEEPEALIHGESKDTNKKINKQTDKQGETDTEAEQTGESFELDINEEVPSSHSHEDENNNDGEITLGSSDYELTEQEEPEALIHGESKDTNKKINKQTDKQGETDTEAEQTGESFELDFNEEVPSSNSHEDENNNDGEITLGSSDYELAEQEEPEALIHGESKDTKKKINKQIDKETMRLFLHEVEAGDTADLIGQNEHVDQSSAYRDLGRRSEPQALKNYLAQNPDYLTPEKAPPELVLLVAKESRLLRAGRDNDLTDFDQNKILRSGNYWDGVRKEDVIPKSAMRSGLPEKLLGSIKAKINPGTEFYKVVSRMQKISPTLLYIINKQ